MANIGELQALTAHDLGASVHIFFSQGGAGLFFALSITLHTRAGNQKFLLVIQRCKECGAVFGTPGESKKHNREKHNKI
jgi:hypothetical protein